MFWTYVTIIDGLWIFYSSFVKLGNSVKNKFLFTMMAYPGQTLSQTTLSQFSAALWDSQSRPVVIQPGIQPESVVTPLALRCSALDRCATRERKIRSFHYINWAWTFSTPIDLNEWLLKAPPHVKQETDRHVIGYSSCCVTVMSGQWSKMTCFVLNAFARICWPGYCLLWLDLNWKEAVQCSK